jgi:ornithine carbamoyltransferase
MKSRHLLRVAELSAEEVSEILLLAEKLKAERKMGKLHHILTGKTLAMIFEKPSSRTRVSFDVAMYQLGGYAVNISSSEIQIGKRESISDVALTLGRFVDGIMIRTFSHKLVEELAKASAVPVINGLTDRAHPCQALADIFTIKEKLGELHGIRLAFVGDGSNNVCHSLLSAATKTGMTMAVAAPKGYEPRPQTLEEVRKNTQVEVTLDPLAAVKNADVIYTDVWTSMGQEKEAKQRRRKFLKYQVNQKLVQAAKPGVLVMHCLPAHRGEEITSEVLDSAGSVVFDQAENRLHVQKAILALLLGNSDS